MTNFEGNDIRYTKYLYKSMLRIRKTEERLLKLFDDGELYGTTHTSIGQEANAVSVMKHLNDGDTVYSNHRCHGHYLAYGGPMKEFFAEVMGRINGIVGGRGGSQHLCYKNFYSNGIQGGIVGNAVGASLAHKKNRTNNLTVVFLGDGTMGQGIVYESLNFAGLWNLPILFVIENNHYAQTTPIEKALSGSLLDRAKSFGIESDQIESNDVVELDSIFKDRFTYIRENCRPFVQIIDTYRTVPHSKGDDFRNQEEIDFWKAKDPLKILGKDLCEEIIDNILKEVLEEVETSVSWARTCDFPTLNNLLNENNNNVSYEEKNKYFTLGENKSMNGVSSLNQALFQILELDNKALLIGEDLLDPYGGAFKVSKGLSTKFPEQVLTTPISEAGITALAIGLAKGGYKPIVEIMFGDFLTLTLDQLLNHASKYSWMYNGKVKVPLVIRTPMGGKRGYGPTHSQSIEKNFLGISGLTVVAASKVFNPGELLIRAVHDNEMPILFIENKSLYAEQINLNDKSKFDVFNYKQSFKRFPTVHLSLNNFKKTDYTIITYGGSVGVAIDAVKKLLIDEEIEVDIIIPSLLSPLPLEDIITFLGDNRKVITLEEGTEAFGWGSEILAQLQMKVKLDTSIRIAALDCPIPSSKPIEIDVLPNPGKVVSTIKELYYNEKE